MRKIKFRAWKTTKSNSRIEKIVHFGLLDLDEDYIIPSGTYLDSSMNPPEENNGPCVIMQYTGLRDKNGKEIYEGDIVDTDYAGDVFRHRVCWSVIGAKFYFSDEDAPGRDVSSNQHYQLSSYLSDRYGVIGNIYENPELLGGK